MKKNKKNKKRNEKKLKSKPPKRSKKLTLREKPTPPKLEVHDWSAPTIFEIGKEAWIKTSVRVGYFSRIDWKDKGARAGLIQLAFEKVFVPRACNYVVLNAGLVSKKDLAERIKLEMAQLSPGQKKHFGSMVKDHALQEVANELISIIPEVRAPMAQDSTGSKLIKIYISTSLILDGEDGERVARIIQEKRNDIILYKSRVDYTRLKKVGTTPEEAKVGVRLGLLNQGKHRIPGQFVSTAIDKEVREEESVVDEFPFQWIVGGFGVSMSKPGGGEKSIPYVSLPACSLPVARRSGEPSAVLNQIGVRVFEVSLDKKHSKWETWSFRDLAKKERELIRAKDDCTELQKCIIDAIKSDRQGLTVGELADRLGVSREDVGKEIVPLVVPRYLKQKTWPGLYKDNQSMRFNLHLDWFQERLRYAWPYDKDYLELRRLLFGCMHAGYTTTDYFYIRNRFPEIILDRNIQVMEIIGDIIAGLKHNLTHRGEIIGNMNYTDQEVFAGELVATVLYDVFVARIQDIELWNELKIEKNPSPKQVETLTSAAMILLLYIVGNHDSWQKELGITPGVVFRAALLDVLNRNIGEYLQQKFTYSSPTLLSLIESRIIALSDVGVYTFPGGIRTELMHPSMARSKTTSIRSEEALGFSKCHLVDVANFHTTIEVEKWEPDLGQRVATQTGCMLLGTEFEDGKMKTVDFGPVYVKVRHQEGRIFMVEHEFFNTPELKKPISRNTNIEQLKKDLKLLESHVRS